MFGCVVASLVELVVLNDGLSCIIDTCNEISDTVLYLFNYVGCGDGGYCNGVETCLFCGLDIIWWYNVEFIVKIKCVGCHIDGGNEGGLSFDIYVQT